MCKMNMMYIFLAFVIPFSLITLISPIINTQQTIYIDILLALLFIVINSKIIKLIQSWALKNEKTNQFWDWAFDQQSKQRGLLALTFLMASGILTAFI